MLQPTVLIQGSGSGGGYAGPLGRCVAGESTMHPSGIVVMLELVQLAHQICSIPEEHAVEVLAPDRADQTFDKGMRNGVYGTASISSISRRRRLASQRWKWNSGS